MSNDLIYLATPYSDPDPAVREARFHAVNKVAASFMRDGVNVFSPISHGHSIAQDGDLPIDWEFWQEYCLAMLSYCCALFVLTVPGWRESVGVQAEIKMAEELDIDIFYEEIKK